MNENLVKTLAIGLFGAAALVLLGPSIAAGAKPIVRRGIKAAVKGYAHGMETLAELQELAEDAYAEACAELRQEAAVAGTAPAASTSTEPSVQPSSHEEEIVERKGKKRTRS